MSEVDDLKAMVQDLLQVIREKDEIIERQQKQIAEQQKQIDALLKENARQAKRIEELEATVAHLEEVNRRLLRRQFGRRTEKTTDPDQTLIPLIGLTCDLECEVLVADESTEIIPTRKIKPQRRRMLWSQLCPDLPIEEVREELPEDQQVAADGTLLVRMGTECCEEVVYEPGRCFIRRVIRQRYGRSDTAEKIVTAPAPTKIVPGGSLANETILATAVHHAMDCLPFQRIAEIMTRTGAPISRSLITNGCNAFAKIAEPLLDVMQQQIQEANIIHVDGSFIYHQDRARKRHCSRKPLYAVTDGQQVVMRHRDDEKYETAADLLPGYEGYLVRDEWAGWSALENANLIHVGCHAHARRYFAETQDHDQDARQIIDWYSELYAIEQRANNSGLTGPRLHAVRKQLRQHYTKPLLEKLFTFAEEKGSSRSGLFRQHANYIVNHRDTLTVFLDDGALPPDNNLAERVLRRNAMLRKNRLFYVGNNCGQHIGTLLSLMVSCRELSINPNDYLLWALPTLLAYRDQRGTINQPDLSTVTPLAFAQQVQTRSNSAA